MMYLECIGLSEYENFARRHLKIAAEKSSKVSSPTFTTVSTG